MHFSNFISILNNIIKKKQKVTKARFRKTQSHKKALLYAYDECVIKITQYDSVKTNSTQSQPKGKFLKNRYELILYQQSFVIG